MSVSNWEDGQGLTWSGRWHYFAEPVDEHDRHRLTLCGAYAYTYTSWPRYVRRLKEIAEGRKDAPVCKKCERAYRMVHQR